jgi:uncharacterized protein
MQIPRQWRMRNQRLALVGEEFPHCKAKLFPPRDVCPECSGPAKEPYAFSGRGEVYSYTPVFSAPDGYREQAPYTVALIRLQEGPLVTAQLTDVDRDDVSIGMPVEMVTRKIMEDGEDGAILYGYKFRPVLEAQSV